MDGQTGMHTKHKDLGFGMGLTRLMCELTFLGCGTLNKSLVTLSLGFHIWRWGKHFHNPKGSLQEYETGMEGPRLGAWHQ
jgi:hypothetical protein